MNVLSLFDGMSCGMIALERAGVSVDNYIAVEIDKWATQVSTKNYPNMIRANDVTKIQYIDGKLLHDGVVIFEGEIDMVMGGSPCQSISNLGDGSGLEGKSGLFWHWLRIRNEVNPKWWLLENVAGNKKALQSISEAVGVESVVINSNLFSAQNRKRHYWTNIEIQELPIVNNTKLVEILEDNVSVESILTPGRLRWIQSEKGQECVAKRYAAIDPEKANCLTARSDASWNCNYVTRNGELTKLSCVEYERLQTVPDNYTQGVPNRERYKMLGNGWTVDVIAHIFKRIREEKK